MLDRRVIIVLMLVAIIMLMGVRYKNNAAVQTIEPYPARPITIIVPSSAGGNMDIVARLIEKTLSKHFGQLLLIANLPGGGNTIGWQELSRAKSDGYTIGITNVGVFLQPNFGPTRYHYPISLEPFAQICPIPHIAIINSKQSWETIEDLIEYAKDHPGKIKYGHGGIGTPSHIIGEIFAQKAGIDIVPVPFNGGNEALAALLGGHVQLMFAYPLTIKDHVKAGNVRMLAVAEDQRLTTPGFQQVPTLKEQGIDVVFSDFLCVAAPKDLSKDVKKQLSEGLKVAINDPDFQKDMENFGLTVEYLDSKACIEKWIRENTRISSILQETGIAELITSQKE